MDITGGMDVAGGRPDRPLVTFERVGDDSGRVRLTVTGEIDFSNSDDLQAAVADVLDAPGAVRIELDLGALRFLDSSGAHALVRCLRMAQSQHVDLVVSNVHGIVLRVLEVLGVDRLLLPARQPDHGRLETSG
jgi:anti-anti-sigma factor